MKPQTIKYAAGLAKYELVKDPATGRRAPRLRQNPGQVHAVTTVRHRHGMREPQFIEDTWAYRVALCGTLIRVVMPMSFKPSEENVCRRCVERLAQLESPMLTRLERYKIEKRTRTWTPRALMPARQRRPTAPNSGIKKP